MEAHVPACCPDALCSSRPPADRGPDQKQAPFRMHQENVSAFILKLSRELCAARSLPFYSVPAIVERQTAEVCLGRSLEHIKQQHERLQWHYSALGMGFIRPRRRPSSWASLLCTLGSNEPSSLLYACYCVPGPLQSAEVVESTYRSSFSRGLLCFPCACRSMQSSSHFVR